MTKYIGMGDAGRRIGIASNSARRALQRAGVPLIAISARAFVVDERDLERYIQQRGDYSGFGRPRKKNAEDDKPPP